jgi:PAS domain S-box-containing protein
MATMRHYGTGQAGRFDVGQVPMKIPGDAPHKGTDRITGRPPPSPFSELSSGRLLIIFGPVLAVGAVTVLLALVAGIFGFHRYEMYLVATVLGASVMVLAVILFYRQAAERRVADTALLSAQARVGDIVDSAMDAIISVDESQRIVLFNAAAEKAFLRPRTAMLGQPLDRLIPERLRASHHGHIERFDRTGATSRRMGDPRVLHGLRANGEEFPIEASISQHREGGRKLFTVILRDVTERVRAEEALRESKEELRELALASQSVREQEKSRIARELHDELAQSLTALKMDVTWLREHIPGGGGPVTEKLGDIEALLDGTVAATRRISADLRPLMLDDLGLVPAVEWLVQKFTERNAIPCELDIGTPDLELHDPHASAVFRILQESLTNAARHARASRIEVSIDLRDGAVALRVRDNGRGFSPDDPRKPGSFGLMGLRERAYLLGGEVNIASEPGRGTTIEVRIPLDSRTVQS